MQKIVCIALLALLVAISSSVPAHTKSLKSESSEKVSYAGYKVYTITLKSKTDAEDLENFKSTLYSVDTWKAPTPKFSSGSDSSPSKRTPLEYHTSIMVPSDLTNLLESYLQAKQFDFSIMVPDLGVLLEEEAKQNKIGLMEAKKRNAKPNAISWTAYYTFDEVMAWLNDLVSENSDIASSTVIGKSYEGRELTLVKISKPGSASNKNAILIDGGFHAREWISPAVVTYILNELLSNTKAHQEVLDAVDLYIIPFINPDGYVHTQKDRMWRKTRSDYDTSITDCHGVDPNRNFDFHFGGPGTSKSKCSEIYHGPSAFSEPETTALKDVLLNKTINWQSYLTLHSYGQWWLTPWSYTYDLPEDYDDLMKFANTGVKALTAVSGTEYIAGATTEILGTTAGCSDDWAKAEAGVKYANTIEMRDTGRYGFALPPAQILPTAKETWAGIRAVCLFDFDSDKVSQ